MKISTLMISVILLLLTTSCFAGASEEKIEVQLNERAFSFEQYEQLYADLVERLDLSGYTKVENNVDNKVIALIDPNVSFTNKTAMTIDGQQNAKVTQNRLVLSSADMEIAVYLDLIYLHSYVGEDIIYSDIPSLTYNNDSIISRYNESLLTYKNVLIRNAVFMVGDKSNESVDKIRADLKKVQYELDRTVVQFLKNYNSTN